MSDDVHASMVPFQSIMNVLYEAAPHHGASGGARTDLIKLYLTNPKIIDLVGSRLFQIDTAFASKTRSARDVIDAATKDRRKAIDALVEEVKAMSRATP